jgi:predicted alpha-1,2-mannosidase
MRIAGVIVATLLALLVVAAPQASAEDLTKLVNPLSGTLGSGFPMVGASRPFGMIQPGPDTALANGQPDEVNYCGYGWQDQTIRSFSLTHFNGAGIHIMGDVPFMPVTGAVDSKNLADYASPFSHSDETAEPGYYSVNLPRYGERVELTAGDRAAMIRTTFPATDQANVIVDPTTSLDGAQDGAVDAVGDSELQGWTQSTAGYRVWFTAIFDRPFKSFTDWGKSGYATFDTTSNQTVTARVAISYVDQQGADRNLAEATSFDAVRAAAHDAWDARLHSIDATGGDPGVRETFYTNLYRVLLMPSLFDDADGRYRGFDDAIRTVAPGSDHYTNLSLWDTYRTQVPLLELIEPKVAHDVAISLLDDYDQGGSIPKWVQGNRDRQIMAGDSGTAAVADGVMEGLLDPTESRRAYAAMLHQATTLPPAGPRDHLAGYLARGYISAQESGRSPSETQEYAIDDAALASVAHRYGSASDAAMLDRRAGYWRNVFDPDQHFPRPRNTDGTWADPAGTPWTPMQQDGYQEGTGWQHLWAEPHDVPGLIAEVGGRDEAISRLDTFFTEPLQAPLLPAAALAQQYASVFGVYYAGNQYTPANETDLWAPWYFNLVGQPWKTQKVARAEMAVYNSRPDGLPGNDDAGTMSAWYVLAALGIYHPAPGQPAWQLNSPAFDRAVVDTGRRMFTIESPGASGTQPYVQSATLNGKPLTRTYLTSKELRSGGLFLLVPSAVR